MKKVGIRNEVDKKATIFGIIFLSTLLIFLVIVFISVLFSDAPAKYLFLLATGFLILFIISGFISVLAGVIKGKNVGLKEVKLAAKSNPYIYYRELPNNYGIGINSLLTDSTIEKEKDIIAEILDLCAKGYLKLQKDKGKYIIKVLKDSETNLLSNEKYIMYMIKQNKVKDINYDEWFNYCVGDGISLKLFKQRTREKYHEENIEEKQNKIRNRYLITSLVITLIITIFHLINDLNSSQYVIAEITVRNIFFFLILFIFVLIILLMPLLYIPSIIIGTKSIVKKSYNISYNTKLTEYLQLTDLGIKEVEKVISFKKFINDFGDFKEKNEEEIVLWNYYLSYAIVFNLASKILKTGYTKLVTNSSFDIDNIDNVHLDNIVLQ